MTQDLNKTIRSYRDLPESFYNETSTEDLRILEQSCATAVTPHVMKTIAGNVTNDAIAQQYIPQAAELKTDARERHDPIGDEAHSPVPGIIHRYPDRALFKITNVCAVYCRYCFRKEMIGPGSQTLKKQDYEAALNYIKTHKEIWEVILTGGDPMVLSPKKMTQVLNDLQKIEHVQIVRIHTRLPLADPKKITSAMCEALNIQKPVYIVLHVNHAREITSDVKHALKDLRKAGCTLLSQSVLLKNVNDTAETLEDLFRKLVTLHVKPYYLHHMDFAKGTGHFHTTIKEGQALMHALQGRLSGLCLPRYMLDIPGGYGKIPLTPCYLESLENGRYTVQDYQGGYHQYPPMEKTEKDTST